MVHVLSRVCASSYKSVYFLALYPQGICIFFLLFLSTKLTKTSTAYMYTNFARKCLLGKIFLVNTMKIPVICCRPLKKAISALFHELPINGSKEFTMMRDRQTYDQQTAKWIYTFQQKNGTCSLYHIFYGFSYQMHK